MNVNLYSYIAFIVQRKYKLFEDFNNPSAHFDFVLFYEKKKKGINLLIFDWRLTIPLRHLTTITSTNKRFYANNVT